MLMTLMYGSTATRPMTEEDLLKILEVSRRNNAKDNLTGMLLYGGGNFLQVLEGEKDKVEYWFNIIEKDERHHGVLVYERRPIEAREFPEWEMGFYNIKHDPKLEQIPGYNDFMNKPPYENDFSDNPSRAFTMMRVFRDSVR